MEGRKRTLEGYSYRTSSRFGGRVKVEIEEGATRMPIINVLAGKGTQVTITGPRIGRISYTLYIVLQIMFLTLIIPAIGASIIFSDWLYLLLAFVLFVDYLLFSLLGASSLWAMAEISAIQEPSVLPKNSFTADLVEKVKIGHGWGRKGLWLVILPYAIFINRLARDHVVSFEAPDEQTGMYEVYAIHMRNQKQAIDFAKILESHGKKVMAA